MRTHSEYVLHLESQRLTDLKKKAAELERKISDVRVSLERAQSARYWDASAAQTWEEAETPFSAARDEGRENGAGAAAAAHLAATPPTVYGDPNSGGATSNGHVHHSGGRTDEFLHHGRSKAGRRRLSRGQVMAAGAAVVAVLVTILVIVLSAGGASWPAGVATVQQETARACQNPDVQSEPGQVNFACAKTTRQILWIFALMTSGDNPDFSDAKTGRLGLEPIAPTQGGEVAWSLNLHEPYNPFNAIDSIEVAARAINNIIGGATLTNADGKPVVQSGLESNPANCVRYTGSAALTQREGFPSRCAKAVTSAAGQAALVADVYRKWIVGAAPGTAQDAAVLFENSRNPGDPRVQAILKQLP